MSPLARSAPLAHQSDNHTNACANARPLQAARWQKEQARASVNNQMQLKRVHHGKRARAGPSVRGCFASSFVVCVWRRWSV